MSSLKMTFSLASLVLILGLVFAIAPVMAQEDLAVPLAGVSIPASTTAAEAAGDADERFIVIGATDITNVVDTNLTGTPEHSRFRGAVPYRYNDRTARTCCWRPHTQGKRCRHQRDYVGT